MITCPGSVARLWPAVLAASLAAACTPGRLGAAGGHDTGGSGADNDPGPGDPGDPGADPGVPQDCAHGVGCVACGDGVVPATGCLCAGAARTTGFCCGGLVATAACPPAPTSDLIAADRITTWRPGILADTQLALALGDDGLPVRTTECAVVSPGGDIQAAIDACPEGQVVRLASGTFTIATTLTLTKGVVLRGAGSQGAPTGTTLVKSGGETVIAIGTEYDGACYAGAYGNTAYALTQEGAKESTTLSIGANANHFSPGDLALVDVVDDGTIVQEGDCPYFKRVDRRSASQRVEVTAVDTSAGTLTVGSPLHWRFRTGSPWLSQVARVTGPIVRWAGVEKLRLQGGTNPGYNGQMAGGIDVSNAAYCWIKDVQTDGTIGGMHVSLTGTYRCVVRDSWLHESADYGFGHDCYGIVLRCGAAENLVENNVVRYMNKPIMLNVTGGGNVIGYNYADNSWAAPPEWQEVNIDCHCSFPHMELIEGNFAPHIGASATHGNAGYLTFYRNYASSVFARPAVAGADVTQTGNVAAVQIDGGDVGMNVVGNVLGTAGVSTEYEAYDASSGAIFESVGGRGATDQAITTLWRHGNFDTVSNTTRWSATSSVRTLPPSLYLQAKPAWWPAAAAWPWVGPDLTPMVGTLPAKSRSDQAP